MQLVLVLILIIVAIFIIVMLLTFVFHVLVFNSRFLLPLATLDRHQIVNLSFLSNYEQVFALLPPEINSGRLTDAYFDVTLDIQHTPRGIDNGPPSHTTFDIMFHADTHQPTEP
jgi:hypothetical protein